MVWVLDVPTPAPNFCGCNVMAADAMAESFVAENIVAVSTQTNTPVPVPVVSAKNLCKSYWLYSSVFRRVMGCFMSPERTGATSLKALSGLTFDVYPGEALALIGKNGAGKSTALQILAGILQPTEGEYIVRGRMSALLELGSGFNPEFTGRENIAIAGALAGLTREEIASQERFIVEFADIGQYIDQPVKYYSSGMFLRLAFAVAIAGEPDLLIVDEALAVGDIFFRQKCYARLREMRERGTAVLLVTHSMGDVTEFCDKAVLLENGRQVYVGDPVEATMQYYFKIQGFQHEKIPDSALKDVGEKIVSAPASTGYPWPKLKDFFINLDLSLQVHNASGASLLRYCLTDENDVPTTTFIQNSIMRLYSEFRVDFPVEIPSSAVTIWNDKGTAIFSKGTSMYDLCPYPTITEPSKVYSLHEIKLDVACGEYTVSHSLGCVLASDFFAQREIWGYEEWLENASKLVNSQQLTIMNVILPQRRAPSRIQGYGIVSLPSKTWMKVERISN